MLEHSGLHIYLPCYNAKEQSVMMAEEPKDKSRGTSSCLSFQYSSSPFENGTSTSGVDEDSQLSIVLYLYEPEDSGSKSETGESSFVSLMV